MTCYGIYKITNLTNGKMYIGKHITNNLDDGYMGSGIWIKRSVKKHGLQNFRKEWLMFCEDEEELNYMERVYVDQTWVDRSDTYNLVLGGEGTCGFHHTEEAKRKMSQAVKGKYCGKNNPMYGIHLTGEKSSMYGKHHTEESKKKMSESLKGKLCGEKNGMYGKHHTDESRKKMSLSCKGHIPWNKGKHHTEESRKKMSISHSNISDETRKKMSVAGKNRNINNHWFNNGIKNVFCKECPEGFVAGRISLKNK